MITREEQLQKENIISRPGLEGILVGINKNNNKIIVLFFLNIKD